MELWKPSRKELTRNSHERLRGQCTQAPINRAWDPWLMAMTKVRSNDVLDLLLDVDRDELDASSESTKDSSSGFTTLCAVKINQSHTWYLHRPERRGMGSQSTPERYRNAKRECH